MVYDHIGFKGAYARTNLSFHYFGDFWDDRISSLIVVSGVGAFIAMNITRAIIGILARVLQSFFTEKGPDDVVSSFQAIELT